MGILVFVERDGETLTEASFDAIAAARDLGQFLRVWVAPVAVGPNAPGFAGVLSRCAMRAAYQVDIDERAARDPDVLAAAVVELAERSRATAVVAPGTEWGNQVIARVAARSGVEGVVNCQRVVATANHWVVTTTAPDDRANPAIDLADPLKVISFDYPTQIVGVPAPRVVPFAPTGHQRADPRVGMAAGGQTAAGLPAETAPSTSQAPATAPSRWTVLLCAAAVFMIALELTVISVAFPKIQAHFAESSRATLSWIFTSYNVGVAALLLLAGWVAERFGRKRVFLIGLVIFLAGSVLSGVAPTIAVMLVGRSIQAVGGAMLLPSSLALMLNAVSKEDRNAAIGVWGATAGLAAALGPTLGALLVEFAGWRWVFLINVPVAVVALVLGKRLLAETFDPQAQRRVDGLAVPVGAAGTGLLVYAIGTVGEAGVTDLRNAMALGGAALLLAIFVRRSIRHEAPVFPTGLMRQPAFAVGTAGTGLFAVAFSAWLTLVPTFFVRLWDYSVLEAGFAVAPAPAIMAVVAKPAGKAATRLGLRTVVVAGPLVAASAVGWWLRYMTETPDYVVGFLPGAILFGIGLGIALPMLTAAALRDVPPRLFPIATAGVTTARQVAMAIGISAGVAIIGSGTPTVEAFKLTWTMTGILCLATAALAQVAYPKPVTLDLREPSESSINARA